MPWLEEMIATFGVQEPLLGKRPVTLNLPCRLALILVTLVCIFSLGIWFFRLSVKAWQRRPALHNAWRQASQGTGTWLAIALLLGPFTVAYIGALLPLALVQLMFDRYLLELLAVAIVVLVKLYQNSFNENLPWLSAVVLLVFGSYSVVQTHDLFALDRARVAAANQIISTGIPRTAIQGGFNFDGWTEIEASGNVNDRRIAVPAHIYRRYVDTSHLPPDCVHWFSEWTPSVLPRYFLVRTAPLPCLAASEFASVQYTAWSPPFHREIVIQKHP